MRPVPNGVIACLTLFFLLISLNPPIRGQSGRGRKPPPPEPSRDANDAVRLRAEEVLLPISVHASDGKAPDHLDKSELIVSEDGKRQRVTGLLRTPANVLFLLDTSGEASTTKNIEINRKIALSMIDLLAAEDRAAILTYGDTVNSICDWTADKGSLRVALQTKFKPGLKPGFYEGLTFAATQVLPKVTGRRSIVLLTDGVELVDKEGFRDALTALHRARATVYVVSHAAMLIHSIRPLVFNKLAWYEMLDPQKRKRYAPLRQYVRDLEVAEVILKQLAEDTGGVVWDPVAIPCKEKKSGPFAIGQEKLPEGAVECEALSAKVFEEIGTEFVVAYSSERRPDDTAFHKIGVYVGRTGIQVRARRGVYSALPPAVK